MNQLDIYLGRTDNNETLLGLRSSKLVFIYEIVKGVFHITEFSNGEVRYYTQEEGKEPVLTDTATYVEGKNPQSRMVTSILNDALYCHD